MKQLIQINLLLLLLAGVSGCSTFGYYSQAIGGHLSLMMRGEPVERLQKQPDTPPELRLKLELAEAARRFARNRLDLPAGDAFTEFVELDRPWVVVNLVAVPEFSLEPHRWCYPVLGCQAYRGYFKLEQARKEEARFRLQGYDTFIGGVTAYSTLGWFDDPLHSGFTNLADDRMVALMFHELAHRVIYIKGDTAFNESFATAVELEGLRLWLDQRGDPAAFIQALEQLELRNSTHALVAATSAELEQLYQRQGVLTENRLRERKQRLFDQLNTSYELLLANRSGNNIGPFGHPPVAFNNARIALFSQYNQHVPAFRQLLKQSGYDFPTFYDAVETLSEKPDAQRQQSLEALSERFEKHF